MEQRGRTWAALEIQVLSALALEARGELDGALVALERALSQAEAEGYVRLFVDEGQPMARLLYTAAERGIAAEYAGRLLAAFDLEAETGGREGGPPPFPATPAPPALVEPLSPRELEVLQLLAQGLSNREIAQRLVLSLHALLSHNSPQSQCQLQSLGAEPVLAVLRLFRDIPLQGSLAHGSGPDTRGHSHPNDCGDIRGGGGPAQYEVDAVDHGPCGLWAAQSLHQEPS